MALTGQSAKTVGERFPKGGRSPTRGKRQRQDGRNAYSFQTLLAELVRLIQDTCGVSGDPIAQGEARTFDLKTQPNLTQRQVIKLLKTIQARSPAPV